MQYAGHRMPLPADTLPINRRAARHAVLDRLRTWIEEGVLAPGEVIKDGEIAERLGVSRTPVREALQVLERLGAVEMLPGRLTRVTAVSPDDVALLYAPLGVLHGLAAEMGAARATEQDVASMTDANERLLAAIEVHDGVAASDADREFHAILMRLAANPYLETAIEPLAIHARRLETLYFRGGRPTTESYEEHKRIIEAVAVRDSATAREMTQRNFTHFWIPPTAPEPADGNA
jgi:DNA-binding GntR family transcriptional regulator